MHAIGLAGRTAVPRIGGQAVLWIAGCALLLLMSSANGQIARAVQRNLPQLLSYRFEPVNDGRAVVDRQTRRMWLRCSLGQTWDGETCVGKPMRLTWPLAIDHRHEAFGHQDWHLPTREELEDLLIEGHLPAIDGAVFPNTPAASFWSASVSTTNRQQAWFVNFGRAQAQPTFMDARFHVRLVRELR